MGHNELDQPSFTQPLMYKQIAKMTPVAQIYEKHLLDIGAVDQEVINGMKSTMHKILEDAYAISKTATYESEDWVTKDWLDIDIRDNT